MKNIMQTLLVASAVATLVVLPALADSPPKNTASGDEAGYVKDSRAVPQRTAEHSVNDDLIRGGGGGDDDDAVVVPEPGTIALLGLGLASLALARRRRAKKPDA